MAKSPYCKAGELQRLLTMQRNQPILAAMQPVPDKATGSRYGACGIRIDGTHDFINAVLSHLTELIDGENHLTRLELARHIVDGSGIGKSLPNAGEQAECLYIRLHQRGRAEGVTASAMFNRDRDEATRAYARAKGIELNEPE